VAPTTFTPVRVLIVEDEAIVRMSTLGMVEALGHSGAGVGSAAEALEALAGHDHGFAVMIVDVGLPDRSGEELARQVREERPATRIIIASGYGSGRRETDESDCSVCRLGKPYDLADLARAFRGLGVAVA
jgi:CheY-like chemotaxis protein